MATVFLFQTWHKPLEQSVLSCGDRNSFSRNLLKTCEFQTLKSKRSLLFNRHSHHSLFSHDIRYQPVVQMAPFHLGRLQWPKFSRSGMGNGRSAKSSALSVDEVLVAVHRLRPRALYGTGGLATERSSQWHGVLFRLVSYHFKRSKSSISTWWFNLPGDYASAISGKPYLWMILIGPLYNGTGLHRKLPFKIMINSIA